MLTKQRQQHGDPKDRTILKEKIALSWMCKASGCLAGKQQDRGRGETEQWQAGFKAKKEL